MNDGTNAADEVSGASIEDIVDALSIDDTTNKVTFGTHTFDTHDMSYAVPELATWLYLHLHVGNPHAFGLDALRPDPVFETEISLRLPDCKAWFPAQLLHRSEGVSHFDVDRVCVRSSSASAIADDAIELDCKRPNLSPGFSMFIHEANPLIPERMCRFYIHHDHSAVALDDWSVLVQRLVAAGHSFRSKMLSRRTSFPRHDAIVVYASEAPDELAALLAEPTLSSYSRPQRKSLFARWSSNGIATAEEPRDPRVMPGSQSFGQHRSLAIARAVQEKLLEGRDLIQSLIEHFEIANIALDDTSKNAL